MASIAGACECVLDERGRLLDRRAAEPTALGQTDKLDAGEITRP